MRRLFGFVAGALAVVGVATAEPSPYAGQERREFTALSAEDVAALRAGQGWELARPAELNGWPGPRHALDLATELELSAEQTGALEAEFAAMQAEAIRAGADYLAAEAALDAAFRTGAPAADDIGRLTEASGQALAALRAVHLAAHLATKALLSADQVAAYGRLRGYGEADEDGAGAGGGLHGGH